MGVSRTSRPQRKEAVPMSSRFTAAAAPASSDLGAKLVALAGLGLVGYGLMFLVRNFTGFIELGLTPQLIGGTPEQIRAFSPHLYHYISHLQAAEAAFMIALGLAGTSLAWQGIRTSEGCALC